MPDTSMIITTRNRPAALRQTWAGFPSWFPDTGEILIYDASTPPDPLEDLHASRPFLHVLRGDTPRAIAAARNALLARATGAIVFCLDDDVDVLTPEACAIVRAYFDRHPRCGVVTFRVWWSPEPPSPEILQADAGQPHACNDFLGGACAIRSACLADAGGFAPWMLMYGEEGYVALGLFQRDWHVHYLPDVLVHHRAVPLEQRQDAAAVRHLVRLQLFNHLGIVAARLPFRYTPRRVLELLSHYGWRYGLRRGLIVEYLAAVIAWLRALPRIIRDDRRLSAAQYRQWRRLPPPVYFWRPHA